MEFAICLYSLGSWCYFSLWRTSGVSAIMLCVSSRGGLSGRVSSRAGGGSHSSGAVDRVCVAVEEQVSKPYISFYCRE